MEDVAEDQGMADDRDAALTPGDLVACTSGLVYYKHISSMGLYRVYQGPLTWPIDEISIIDSTIALVYLGRVRRREMGIVWSPLHGVTLLEPAGVDRLKVISSVHSTYPLD